MSRRRCLSEPILNRCAAARFRALRIIKKILSSRALLANDVSEEEGEFPRVILDSFSLFFFLSFFLVPRRRARNEIFTVYYAKLQNFYFALKIRLLYYDTFLHGRKYEKYVTADPKISPFIILTRILVPAGIKSRARPREIRDVIISSLYAVSQLGNISNTAFTLARRS